MKICAVVFLCVFALLVSIGVHAEENACKSPAGKPIHYRDLQAGWTEIEAAKYCKAQYDGMIVALRMEQKRISKELEAERITPGQEKILLRLREKAFDDEMACSELASDFQIRALDIADDLKKATSVAQKPPQT